jgi:hypothetical protein
MRLCDNGHDEVAYEGRNCPVCEKIIEIAALEKQLQDAQIEISDLNNALNQAAP